MKYNIEGGIDFYAELNKDINGTSDISDNNDIISSPNDDDDTNKCLITRLPLLDGFVRMECGHSFNYLPLYNELVQQQKPSICGYAKIGRIVCPFCRHSQQTFLPYNPAFKLVVGVNLYPMKLLKSDSLQLCQETKTCSLIGCVEIAGFALASGENYCQSHKLLGLSIAKQKAFHEAFLLKKSNNEIKMAKKQTQIKTIAGCCTQILKTGIRKGQECACKKVINGTTFCSRHTSHV
jgi:hypothetical protein